MQQFDSTTLLRIYRAVAGPTQKRHVEMALMLIKNKGVIPVGQNNPEIRTWYRVRNDIKELLKDL